MNLYAGDKAGITPLRLRLFNLGEPIPLFSSLPMLERMGVTKCLKNLTTR